MNQDDEIELPEFPRDGGRGSGTTYLYRVLTRCSKPFNIGQYLISNEWQVVQATESAIGVPRDPQWGSHGLHSYESAEALRWWFLSVCAREFYHPETRLIACKVEHSYKIVEEEAIKYRGSYWGRDE